MDLQYLIVYADEGESSKWMENTYLYLASLQLLYLDLDLCGGKKLPPPPYPFNLGIHTGWLIDSFFD